MFPSNPSFFVSIDLRKQVNCPPYQLACTGTIVNLFFHPFFRFFFLKMETITVAATPHPFFLPCVLPPDIFVEEIGEEATLG
jgi:hypothetical protein